MLRTPFLTTLGMLLLAPTILHAGGITFSYTGAEQTYVVPAGVTSLLVAVKGGAGAMGGTVVGGSVGGTGAIVTATLPVTPGETLAIYVGGNGGQSGSGSAGGFNGGGDGGTRGAGVIDGGGGGGASDIRQGGNTLAQRVIIAGGGGGGGGGQTNFPTGPVAGRGGASEFLGQDGGNSPGDVASGGLGASQTAGGNSGTNFPAAFGSDEVLATAGSLGAGGRGGVVGTGSNGSAISNGGGGGGGGLFGGGGGGGTLAGGFRAVTGASGGGGGSSYAISTATDVTFAVGNGTGSVTVSPNIVVSTEAALRQAIQNATNGDTITLTTDLTLTDDLPPVLKDITLQAGHHVLDGAGIHRILFAQGGTLTLGAIGLAHGEVVSGSGTTGNIAGDFTMSSGTNLRFERSDDVEFDATLGGDGTVTQNGAGVLTLGAGSGTFTGNLVVNAGRTVKIAQESPAFSQIANDGTVIFRATASSTYGGVISGSGNVVQSNLFAHLTLGGLNTYSGGTTIQDSSTVSFTALDNLGTGPLVFDNGVLEWSGTNSTDISGRLVTLQSAGVFNIPDGTTVTFSNPIGNGGSGAIEKTGEGTLVLLASPDSTGATEVVDGNLRLGPGVHVGQVYADGSSGSLECEENTVMASLYMYDGSSLRLKIGSHTPPVISGDFTAESHSLSIALDAEAALTPGQTYTLLTYAITNCEASDLLPDSRGTFIVEPHALKFKVAGEMPALAHHKVAIKTAQGKNRVTYTVANTGNVNAVYRITADATIQSSLRAARLLRRSVTITTTLNGDKAPKALTGRGALVSIAPGDKARIAITVTARGNAVDVPAVRTTLRARDIIAPEKSDSGRAVIKP